MFYDNITSLSAQEQFYPDAPVRVLLANPGREGSESAIESEWISLPATTVEVQEVFGRLGLAGNPAACSIREVIIPGIVIDELKVPDLCSTLKMGSLDELNFFTVTLCDQNAEQLAIYCTLLECGERTGSIKDIINLGWNLDNYEVSPEEAGLARYGLYEVEVKMGDIPSGWEPFIDLEGIGRLECERQGHFIGRTMQLDRVEDYFFAEYNGRNVPEKYCVTPQAQVPEKRRNAPGGMER